MNNKNKYWDFYYNYDEQTLAHFINLSAEEKLGWLEEFLEFLEEAMTPEAKRIWAKFRSGELGYPAKKM
ncbi:hypothetical protein DRQ36_05965 [bacterium]|nr:MAG: hypothetical protein DRQ36_05965 [bacterium]